jgi:transcriptional regulator with XRE-family HTH domain
MAFSDNLLKIMKLRNKKAADIVRETGISKQNLSNWKTGAAEPRQDQLDILVKYLRVSKDLFYKENLTESDLNGSSSVSKRLAENIPFYDTVAVAGLEVFEADQSPQVKPTETVNPGTWFRSASAAMRVYGDSMFPKYKSGCIIALKEIHDKEEIIYGEDYVLETAEQRVLKRILKSEKGAEYIEMNSINPQSDSKGKQIYASKDFHLNKIRRVYKVLGQIQYETGGDTIIHRH